MLLGVATACAHPIQRSPQRGLASVSDHTEKDQTEKDQSPRPVIIPADARLPKAESMESKLTALSQLAPQEFCDLASLPLEVRFADYSLDSEGLVVQDGGWSQQQRDLFTGFLCKMLPVLEEVYGPPYVKYAVTLLRDARYTASNVFIIPDKTIRTDGAIWNPQLITHEFAHAFRGDWTLTKGGGYYQYSPELSGYEEGFAQAISYEAMNRYIERWGLDLYVNRNFLWAPESEWNYDFKNDGSMVTQDFWTDLGATRILFERYEQSAALMVQLSVQISDFYRRFNATYYSRIRSDPDYLPTKERIDALIRELAPSAQLSQSLPGWLSKQNIIQCKIVPGKKIWSLGVQSTLSEPLQKIYFVETFPNGSEWYYRLETRDYLYHRLNGTSGTVGVERSWSVLPWVRDQAITMDNPGFTIGGKMVLLHSRDATIPPSVLLPIRQPSESGLYVLRAQFMNPHYSPAPAYGFTYDQKQTQVLTDFPILLGFTEAQWSSGRIFGGVQGLKSGRGRVSITHSSQPGLTVSAEIQRGAFTLAGPAQWFTTVRNGAFAVMRPGTLTFRFQDYVGGATFMEQRFVSYGIQGGKHQFLFQAPVPPPRKAPATRAD